MRSTEVNQSTSMCRLISVFIERPYHTALYTMERIITSLLTNVFVKLAQTKRTNPDELLKNDPDDLMPAINAW